MIADSSGLVSLVMDTDGLHEAALAAGQKFKDALTVVVVPADVFSETMNILGKLSGHSSAYTAARELLAPGTFVHVETSESLRETALEKFNAQPGSVSYTDCVVMAFADHYDTKQIFGFDQAFQRAGYHLPSAVSEQAEA